MAFSPLVRIGRLPRFKNALAAHEIDVSKIGAIVGVADPNGPKNIGGFIFRNRWS
jgi:hypothetical protein